MSNSEEHIKTLTSLGLSGTQARICLALSSRGLSTVKEITEASGVARPDTYRALLELENKGLIEKTLSNPTRYKLLPLPEVLSMLVGQREQESIRIQENSVALLKDFQKKTLEQESPNEVVLIPNGKAFTNRLNKLISTCQKSICVIASQKKLSLFLDNINETLLKNQDKEIHIRIVTEKCKNNDFANSISSVQKLANLEVRYADFLPPFSLASFDEKEILLLMETVNASDHSAATYSNNPSLVELSQSYFNDAWFSAGEPLNSVFKRNEEQFDNLFANMFNGFFFGKVIFENGKPKDFVYLQVNQAFERITGLKRGEVIGRKATEIVLGLEKRSPEVLEIYGRVSTTGKPEEAELFLKALNVWSHISVYSPQKGYFAVVFEDITNRKMAEEALLKSKSLIDTTFANVRDAIITFNLAGEVLEFNDALVQLYDFQSRDKVPKNIQGFSDLMHVTLPDGTQVTDFSPETTLREKRTAQEYIVKRKDTGQTWIVNHTFAPLQDENGNTFGIVLSLHDVTETRQNEEKLKKLNRTLKAISAANHALIHATDEKAYLLEGCRLIQEQCGYKMVWIGFAIDNEEKSIVPAVYAGFEKGYLESRQMTWADCELGQFPTARAIRTGKPQFCDDIATDASLSRWREESLNRGYASSIAIPLKADGKTFGNITMYTSQPNHCSLDEVELLTEMADDLAYGITILRMRKEKEQSEKERELMAQLLPIINQASSVSELAHVATEFFKEKLGCEAVGIRLKNSHDYPYIAQKGFPISHIDAENNIVLYDSKGNPVKDLKGIPLLECMCGSVISGKFDPTKKFFTPKGSFWTNSTTELLSTITDADRQTKTRNRCNKEGFESVALIALCVGDNRVGLIQLNDKRKSMFTFEAIQMWERVAAHLALAFSKTIAQESRAKS